jgi:hypothetical protein
MTIAPSRHTGPTTTAPSSTVGTYCNKRERKLTFASEWYFKPEGVRDVKERFEAELRRKEIVSASVSFDIPFPTLLSCAASGPPEPRQNADAQQTLSRKGLVKCYSRIYRTLLTHNLQAAQYEWSNTDYIFRVRCLAGEVETIWPLFQNILRTIIKEEGGEIDRSCDYDSDSTTGGNDENIVSHGLRLLVKRLILTLLPSSQATRSRI